MVNVGKYTSAMHPMGREALEFFWTKQKLLECLLRISLQALGSWYLVSSKPCPQHVWQTRIHQAVFSLIYLSLGFESDAWKKGKTNIQNGGLMVTSNGKITLKQIQVMWVSPFHTTCLRQASRCKDCSHTLVKVGNWGALK